jgi:hypothetical protein
VIAALIYSFARITAHLENGGALEHAQAMAAHESPRTTKLYDRSRERLAQGGHDHDACWEKCRIIHAAAGPGGVSVR